MDLFQDIDAKMAKLAKLNAKFPSKKLLNLHMRDTGKFETYC